MCIYLKNQVQLTYTSREHIFPAGLGGIKRLPKDYVSLEFNNRISLLEQDFMRKALVSFARIMEGPGKRGSLSDTKSTTSEVVIIKNEDNPTQFALGYAKLARLHEITHFSLNLKTGEIRSAADASTVTNHQEHFHLFLEQCRDGRFNKTKIISDDQLPKDTIYFGLAEGVEENFDSYFAKNSATNFEFSIQKIQKIAANINPNGQFGGGAYQPSAKLPGEFSQDHFRIYGKMAFNYLAHCKGKDFVLNTCFDSFRMWIATGGENTFAVLNKGLATTSRLSIPFPESSHVILINKVENSLIATIYLYGAFSVILGLSTTFTHDFDLEGFICDWKNRQEFTFQEYSEFLVKSGITI